MFLFNWINWTSFDVANFLKSYLKIAFLNKKYSHVHYQEISHILLCLYCASASLSFFVSQLLVGVFIACTTIDYIAVKRGYISITSITPKGRLLTNSQLYFCLVSSLFAWPFASLISSLVGTNPAFCLLKFASSIVWFAFPLCITYFLNAYCHQTYISKICCYLTCFGISTSLAGIHSALCSIYSQDLPPNIPGPITLSGQLALVIPMLIGLHLIYTKTQLSCNERREVKIQHFHPYLILYLISLFSVILSLIWADYIAKIGSEYGISAFTIRVFFTFIAGLIVMKINNKIATHSLKQSQSIIHHGLNHFTTRLIVPIMIALSFSTLIINLKRGPWMGVIVELLILGLILSKRIAFYTIIGVIIVFICAVPARNRFMDFADDFSIKGGRKNMWQLGVEIVQRFPMGVGLGNAKYMRVLDPSLPPTHRHMHNNLLNVAVETGWIGIACYAWWIASMLSIALRLWKHYLAQESNEQNIAAAILSLCISISIIGWQVAGLVEYNFGDGEIRFMVFALLGFLMTLSNGNCPSTHQSLTSCGYEKV